MVAHWFPHAIPVHSACIHRSPVQKNGIQYTLPPLPSPLISAFIFSQLLSILPHSATSAISKPSPAPYFCLNAAAPAAPWVHHELRKPPGLITYGITLLPLHNSLHVAGLCSIPWLSSYDNLLFSFSPLPGQHSCKQCCCPSKQEEVSCQIGRVSGLRCTS
jgi:hypothetical protein